MTFFSQSGTLSIFRLFLADKTNEMVGHRLLPYPAKLITVHETERMIKTTQEN